MTHTDTELTELETLALAINARFNCGAFVTNTGGNCMAVEIPTNNPQISCTMHCIVAGLEIWNWDTGEPLKQLYFENVDETATKLTPIYLNLVGEMMQEFPHLFTEVNK